MSYPANLQFSPYRVFQREEWARLRADTPMTLKESELEQLSGLLEELSVAEVEEIYLPMSRLLNLYVAAAQQLHSVSSKFLGRTDGKVPFIIGVGGSVAVGKSTTARVLKALLARWPDHPRVDQITTDGFLWPNAELERRKIMDRKGFPDSFDTARLLNFLASVKSGVKRVEAPVYSHFHYDILPDQKAVIESPDILIVEGLNVLQPARMPRGGEAIPFRVGFLRFLDLSRRRSGGDSGVVCGAFHAPANHRLPRSCRLLPSIREPVAGGGAHPSTRHLAQHQPQEPGREHPADAPARQSHPAQGSRPSRRLGRAAQAVECFRKSGGRFFR